MRLRAAGVSPCKIMGHSCQLGFHGDSSEHWYPGHSIGPSLASPYSQIEIDYANEANFPIVLTGQSSLCCRMDVS